MGLIAVVIIRGTGMHVVPGGKEGLLVRRDGSLVIYRPGWHMTGPFSGDFVLFPSGGFELRYPDDGDRQVMLGEGVTARAALLFELEIPQGSADDLYREFGTEFAARLDALLYDAVEIGAARFSPARSHASSGHGGSMSVEPLMRQLTSSDVRFG